MRGGVVAGGGRMTRANWFYSIPGQAKPGLNFQGAYPKPGKCPDCGAEIILTTPCKKCDACRIAGKKRAEAKSKAKRRAAK